MSRACITVGLERSWAGLVAVCTAAVKVFIARATSGSAAVVVMSWVSFCSACSSAATGFVSLVAVEEVP